MATAEQLDLEDADAIEHHATLDADAGYALLAEKTWAALRALGVERGRMLFLGDHAHTFTGIPVPDTVYGHQEEAVNRAGGVSLALPSQQETCLRGLGFAAERQR
ncbi:hypothetical protein APR04_004081 [Promicromonospora umidemergens]|uniref:Alkaline phosphatase n=1 Tax=Promicromonospora umidemergens TaxID=629679 RepID=A0ABP8XV68_9MICO|nr:hypothetical protein [Promicromonospora umidemergens]